MSTIASAFVKAKRSFGPALKDKTNPAFRSKYADLGACIDAVEEALLANGIAFIQETSEDPTGVTVETVFLHESGETIRCGKLHVPAAKQDPQGYGSALTYARRYSLMTACGIAPEDDDGNAAKAAAEKARGGAPAKPALPANVAVSPAQEIAQDWATQADPARIAELDELTLYLIDCHQAGRDMDAIKMYYAADTFKENEERAYVWANLGTHSKLRSTIKANKP